MEKTSVAAAHVGVFPCAGMGHLIPYLRLAAMLHSTGCTVTLITAHPTISDAESNHISAFFAAYPLIKSLKFQPLRHTNSKFTNNDPFFVQMEAIANSVHLLHPPLSSLSPPLSAIVVDFPVLTEFSPVASDLSIPMYTLITTSARFFSLMVHLPQLLSQNTEHSAAGYIDVPSLGQIPVTSIPPPMLNPTHFFAANITSNVKSLSKLKGVLISTFDWFEPEAIESLRRNGVQCILPVGPLEATGKEQNLPWLEAQAPRSVLYISFGSRAAHSKDDLREFAVALDESGWKFLWVLKGGRVDREDKEEVEEIVGASFFERTKNRGLIIKGWVDQEQILSHPSIGGFVSHGGWNSVMEAAKLGVPMLFWPQGGDQFINSEAAEKAGLGVRVRVRKREEMVEKLMEVMNDHKLTEAAIAVKEKALEAAAHASEILPRRLLHGN